MQIYGICPADAVRGTALYDRLYAAATPDRRARADRCRRPEDAARCLLGGALLRYALMAAGYPAAVVDDPPSARGDDGKPCVLGLPDFHFNLSHGGAWVVLAWDHTPVGVDIEPVAATRDVRAMAARYFSPEESAHVTEAAAEADARERFYALWVAKESYLKYTGAGLTRGMATPSVLKDGAIAEGVYLTRARWPDGHWLAVCGREPAGEVQRLSLADLLDPRK